MKITVQEAQEIALEIAKASRASRKSTSSSIVLEILAKKSGYKTWAAFKAGQNNCSHQDPSSPTIINTVPQSPTVASMSADEIAEAFCVVMDSSLQEELMNNPDDQRSWMLDFVYDSSLLKELEIRASEMNVTSR